MCDRIRIAGQRVSCRWRLRCRVPVVSPGQLEHCRAAHFGCRRSCAIYTLSTVFGRVWRDGGSSVERGAEIGSAAGRGGHHTNSCDVSVYAEDSPRCRFDADAERFARRDTAMPAGGTFDAAVARPERGLDQGARRQQCPQAGQRDVQNRRVHRSRRHRAIASRFRCCAAREPARADPHIKESSAGCNR